MLFNSYTFIFLFLPITLVGYALVGNFIGRLSSIIFLCAASLFFYSWWNPKYLPLILFSLALNYVFGLILTKYNSQVTKRGFLYLGVAINLSLLGYFKYANFFIDNYKSLTGASFHWDTVILPIAISFFTFQQIAYLADSYSGKTKEHSVVSYILFVTFFPQLIAGPIVHHSEMMPQFEAQKKFSLKSADISIGLTIFILGLFKKLVIADTMGSFATPVFELADMGESIHIFEAWCAALSYTFQLYFDFSGYSDMAIGLGRLFGIKLPINFDSPYKSTSIIDFWRRWHVTLSRFLRDYLYIPLGGNRKGEFRRNVNLMITMLLGGLWHGAGWNFLLWGGLHGIYLVINQIWRGFLCRLGVNPYNSKLYSCSSLLLTFLVVTVAWVPFRATSLNGTQTMLTSMITFEGLQNVDKVFSTEPVAKGQESVTVQSWGLLKKYAYSSDQKLYLDIFSSEQFNSQFLILEIFNLDIGGGYWIIFCFIICWLFPNTIEIMRNYDPAYEVYDSERKFSLFSPCWKPNIVWALTIGIYAFTCVVLLGSKLSEFLYFQF